MNAWVVEQPASVTADHDLVGRDARAGVEQEFKDAVPGSINDAVLTAFQNVDDVNRNHRHNRQHDQADNHEDNGLDPHTAPRVGVHCSWLLQP